MEGRAEALSNELQDFLQKAAGVSLQLEEALGRRESRPHYSQIEARAHALGQDLSRAVRQRRMAELVAEAPAMKKCPVCGTLCRCELQRRSVSSIDGSVDLPEKRCECPVCRRAFFPSAGGTGV